MSLDIPTIKHIKLIIKLYLERSGNFFCCSFTHKVNGYNLQLGIEDSCARMKAESLPVVVWPTINCNINMICYPKGG